MTTLLFVNPGWYNDIFLTATILIYYELSKLQWELNQYTIIIMENMHLKMPLQISCYDVQALMDLV